MYENLSVHKDGTRNEGNFHKNGTRNESDEILGESLGIHAGQNRTDETQGRMDNRTE